MRSPGRSRKRDGRMTPALTDPHTAFAIDLAIDILLKASVVIAVAGLANWWMRRASAALRNAVWTVALGSLLLLPLLSATLPTWRLPPFDATIDAKVAVASDPGYQPEQGDRDAAGAAYAATSGGSHVRNGSSRTSAEVGPMPETRAARALSAIDIALLIWYSGVLVLLGRIGLNGLRIHRMTQEAKEPAAELSERANRLVTGAGIERPVRILMSDAARAPLTWGALAPVVILPEAAANWPDERTRVALLHELAHIKRWDYPALLIAEIACAIYWLNPLVWLAAKQGAMERERACDDEALYSGVPSDVYAGHLLAIAQEQVGVEAPRAAFAMARPWSLATRVRMILARGLDRSPLTRGRAVSTGLVALLVALPLASMDMAQDRDPVDSRMLELRDDDPRVRRHAAWALGELEDRVGVGPLIQRLRDEDADVRLVAAWALGEIKDEGATQPLISLLEDDDPLVREMAVLSLGEIEDASAIEPLTAALQPHDELREPVIWALGEIGGREAEAAREAIFADWGRRPYGNEEVWTGRLSAHRPPGDEDVTALIAQLRDGDPRARVSAAEGLGRIGAERAVDALLDALRDPDPAVRAMVIWSLDETNPSS